MVKAETLRKEGQPISQVLLFDLGGVVLAYDHNYTHAYLEEPGVSQEAAPRLFQCDEYAQFSRGEIDENAFCDALRIRLRSPALTNDQLLQAHHKQIYGLVPGMKELIEKLAASRRIVFVTDTNVWQNARQQELIDLREYTVITSNSIGVRKVDSEVVDEKGEKKSFFPQALGILNIFPNDTLLIDDNPKTIEAAQKHGMQTVLFSGSEALENELKQRGILKD